MKVTNSANVKYFSDFLEDLQQCQDGGTKYQVALLGSLEEPGCPCNVTTLRLLSS